MSNLNINKIDLHFKYQSVRDGDIFSSLKEIIDYSIHTLFLIKIENEMKFGFFIEDTILIENEKYIYRDNNCFMVSFQKEGIFKCIGDNNKLEISDNNDGLIIIGDGDIIIKNNFLQFEKNMGKINYPFKSFDISNINKNIFTESNGEFKIRGIEIFSFIINNNN